MASLMRNRTRKKQSAFFLNRFTVFTVRTTPQNLSFCVPCQTTYVLLSTRVNSLTWEKIRFKFWSQCRTLTCPTRGSFEEISKHCTLSALYPPLSPLVSYIGEGWGLWHLSKSRFISNINLLIGVRVRMIFVITLGCQNSLRSQLVIPSVLKSFNGRYIYLHSCAFRQN